MKARVAKWHRIGWLLSLAVCCGLEAASPADWVFRGFFVLGEGKEFVSLATTVGEARWLPIGGSVEGHRLVRLDRERGTVALITPSGQELIVNLQGVTVGVAELSPAPEAVATEAGSRVKLPIPVGATESRPAAPESEIVDVFPAAGSVASSEGLDWEWIKSDDNPMKKMATLPSRAESAKWGQLTEEQRDDLIELYRQCGWAVTVFVRRNGLVSARFEAVKRPGESVASRPEAAAAVPPDRR